MTASEIALSVSTINSYKIMPSYDEWHSKNDDMQGHLSLGESVAMISFFGIPM